ncbi:MAG: hypothetical protein OXE46_05215 [Chloroflexi bacterium]|nr:hypothetical protein [Chloroflexota bacterium]
MTAEMLRYSELTDNEVNFYDKYGYLSLPGLLSREAAEDLAGDVLHIMAGLGISLEALHRASTSKDKLRQSRQYLGWFGLGAPGAQRGFEGDCCASDGRTIDCLPAFHSCQEWWRRWQISFSPGQSIHAL